MKLIIESGSTKTDWKYKTPEGVIESASSMGINPTIQSSGEIKDEQDNTLRKLGQLHIDKIEYYGAGCGDIIAEEKIRDILNPHFTGASISVESDIIAAYKSVFNNQNGIVSILGTGSNSGQFVGGKMVNNVKSLGYLMGDEGSGSQIGKDLMRDYFRAKLPKDISNFMDDYFGKNKDEVLKEVYRLKYPNRYFARLVKDIIGANKNNTHLLELVEKQFQLFFDTCLMEYKDIHENEVGFIGSIAYYFQDILINMTNNHRLNLRKIIKQPIDQLVLLDN